MEIILMQPVATRRAKFWIIWNFWINDFKVFGNHTGLGKRFVANKNGFPLLKRAGEKFQLFQKVE